MKYSYGKLTENKFIVSNQLDLLQIYEIKDNKLIFIKEMKLGFGKDEYFRSFEFLETENNLIIGKKNGIIQFINLESEAIIREVKLPLSDEYYFDWNLDILKLSNDENWLAVGQPWYTVYPLNLNTLSSTEISIPAQPLQIKYSFDNKYVALIHGEQGGQGLIVYRQNEIGDWQEVYEYWATSAFEFSKKQNVVYHFGLKDTIGVLTKVNLIDSSKIEWEAFFTLTELGNENIHSYGFGLNNLTIINNSLEFSINNKTIILDETNGQVLENYTNNNRTIQTLCNSTMKVRLTEDKIIMEKI
ncbi:hypothetical protein [Flectobacillus rivi]|uniref:Uncharacterized protein n=1 Tax=Flectobacillus rivi TaxID=2984209 RepID=A0ABT6Z510_9BACT|nr:hypothetical protein [Flectobacillus rivi]MDI9876215.1 hypothetical protein [Flectobacillus rivi]